MTELGEAQSNVLQVQGVTVQFGGITALSDVSFDLGVGSFSGLIGPNGAGKSTLFAVMSGLVRPTTGRVALNGEDVTRLPPQVRAQRGLARTFQHPEVFPTLSVEEHLLVAYRASHRGETWRQSLRSAGRTERRQRRQEEKEREQIRIGELLETLGISDLADRPVAGLPLGTIRRVEVGRALATDPIALLLDEASSGLDTHETEQLGVVLQRAWETQSISIVLVEHDLDFVLGLCSTIHVLDFGTVIASGTPNEVRSNTAVQEAYIGSERL